VKLPFGRPEKVDRVKFSFRDQQGNQVGSSDFAKQVLAATVQSTDAVLARDILAESNWRKNYQSYFLRLSAIEFGDRATSLEVMQSALSAMTAQIKNQGNNSIAELAVTGFATSNLVETIEISGTAPTENRWPGANQNLYQLAADWVARDLAEPDVFEAFKFLDANPTVRPAGDLLFALAGNAELSGAKDWLSLGGRVAVVARPNPAAWQLLIEHAQRSAGTLLIPVLRASSSDGSLAERAGLDLVQDVAAIASWLHHVSRSESRVVISSYAYIGGSNQIIAQAAQDALIAAASANLAKSKLALTWLATPLDVIVVGPEVLARQNSKLAGRSGAVRMRDVFWRMFGQLQPAQTVPLETTSGAACLFDASSVRQGSSYLLAKHSEKWRAMVAARQGNLVSYTVAPPAATRSVLSVRVLNYTYRALDRFGVHPFSAQATSRALALLLLRNLNDPASPAATNNSGDQVALVSATAIHGGTWRMAYRPDSIWVVATLLGVFSRQKKNAIVDVDSASSKASD
jgi:hypothetical protein